jgi:hypothetical protein
MKLKITAVANAAGLLGAIYFVGCYLVAWIMPDLYKSVAESWMHMLNLDGLWKQGPSEFVTGFISFVIVSWVTGYIFAWLYNKFVK